MLPIINPFQCFEKRSNFKLTITTIVEKQILIMTSWNFCSCIVKRVHEIKLNSFNIYIFSWICTTGVKFDPVLPKKAASIKDELVMFFKVMFLTYSLVNSNSKTPQFQWMFWTSKIWISRPIKIKSKKRHQAMPKSFSIPNETLILCQKSVAKYL